MHRVFLLLVLVCGLLMAQQTEVKSVADASNNFGVELFKKLCQKEKGNLFLSPASIEMALAMTYAGARGETAAQMKKVLHLFGEPTDKALHGAFGKLAEILTTSKKNLQISVANSLWAQKGYSWKQDFMNLVTKAYKSGLFMVDFATDPEACRQKINAWVGERTKEKIKNLIPSGSLDILTRLVLVNAIYFKGTWKTQFDKKDTKKAPFWFDAKSKKQVDMMYLRSKYLGWGKKQEVKFRFYHNAGAKFSMIELPYGDGEAAMVVLLPDKVDGLSALQKSLTHDNLKKWLATLDKLRPTKMDEVALPKFKITWGAKDMVPLLKEMGMVDAVSMSKADFSGMDGTKRLYVKHVFHKAFVDVNEEGTEAAAATAVVVAARSVRIPKRFIADHPFIFLIRHKKTGAILFMGRVVDPAAE